MDGIRWYLQGLLDQPFASCYAPFTVPEVSADGLLGRVQTAAQGYYLAVNTALYLDHLAAIKSWTERRDRISEWLAVVDAGEDLDSVAQALAKMAPTAGGGNDRDTTLFDVLDELAALEGRSHADRMNLQRAVVFYLAAVDGVVRSFTQSVGSRASSIEQQRFAEDSIRKIENHTMRISDIQQHCPSGSGTRPLV